MGSIYKTALIAGAAGFIGSHLTERLLKDGYKVIALDNYNDYYDPLIKKRNILDVKRTMEHYEIEAERMQIIEADIRDLDRLDEIFRGKKPDIVVHLAAMAGVRPSINNPLEYYEVNIKGTVNMLEMCRKQGIGKFVFASSSSVYGNNEKIPFSEADNVDKPISPYAATKRAGELMCHTWHFLYGIDIACLRFFTVYGPRQRPDLAIHKFTRMILNDEEIPFYGDGNSERDYTYIDDIIDGIVKAMNWVSEGAGKYDIFNLGESNAISLSRMVEVLEKALSRKARLRRLPMQPGDVQTTYADISKSAEVLGYQPSMDFEVGIGIFVDWYLKWLKSELSEL
jgi:UDP-glucuronate 4-epimerase